MKTMLTSVFVALALAATLGAKVASANVAVQLEIKNQSTNTAGHFVSATTGQKVKFAATLKSLVGKKATGVVTLRANVPSIPGCSVTETRTVTLSGHEVKNEWMAGVVPTGRSGVLLVDISATVNGVTATDHAELTFGPSKTAGISDRWFNQAYVRLLVKGLMMAITSDETQPTNTTMGAVKLLFR
ncbi:MAG TPA: hypothetical protein VFE28_16945 [Candidatus Krumholzibacteria bacterium]|nr:hypothetical protein [Candidatus Krumholzibacteria bacterium]